MVSDEWWVMSDEWWVMMSDEWLLKARIKNILVSQRNCGQGVVMHCFGSGMQSCPLGQGLFKHESVFITNTNMKNRMMWALCHWLNQQSGYSWIKIDDLTTQNYIYLALNYDQSLH